MTLPPPRPKLNLRKNKSRTTIDESPWRVLVVDDDAQVHMMTDLLFQDFSFDGHGFQAIHAYSAAEARTHLEQDPLIPVTLVDVVMERPDAGLNLIRIIRNDLNNHNIRIILRTGQPGEAPERDVVLDYDINDYKSKTELTSQKLYTALISALRAWRDILKAEQISQELAKINVELEQRVQARTQELTSALENARLAKRDLRQFLSMMSHEFRTPLAIIDSAAQMLLMRNDDRRQASKPRLETIRGGVTRLVGLIDTCLADDRLETESLELRATLTDLAPLIHAAIDQQRLAHPQREIALDLPPLAPLLIDAGLLAMAINNLVNNAIKYSSSAISIILSQHPDHMRMDISDQGIGIPEGELPYIFDRFYRAENVKGMAGSGIGLHMSQRIATLHGGTLTVSSVEGRGSTFTLCLPVPAPDATA